MKTKQIFLIVAVSFMLAACSGIKVTHDYDKSVDFGEYKTFEYYGWAEESDKIMNELTKKRIEKAFGNELNKRGLEYVEEGGDLVVVLFIVTQDKTQKTAHTTHMGGGGGYYGGYYGYGPGWGWGSGMGHSTTTISEYDYTEGTLVIDIFDAKNEKLIFEGIGTKTIVEKSEGRDERVAKAVAAIMANYPVKPIK